MSALRKVLANPDLRRLQLSLVALVVAGSGYQVALAVVAFREGGVDAVAIAFFVQVLPIALATPFTSALADRFPRGRVMVCIDVLRCLCTAAVASAVELDGSLVLVLVLGAPGALVSGAYAPASRALLPSLVSDPEELSSANAVMSGVEQTATLVGPALFGALLVFADVALVFAVSAALFLASALVVARIDRSGEELRRAEAEAGPPGITAGFRMVGADAALRLLIVVYAAQWFVAGALDVFVVVMASDLTGLGDAGVGVFFAMLGLGGLVGMVVVVALGGRRRLTLPLAVGGVLWGAPLVLIGLAPHSSTALAGLAVMGLATVLIEVSVVTLLQRSVPEEVLGRVFGVLETALLVMVAAGTIAAPLFIEGLGTEGALVAVGAILPLLIGLLWRALRGIDAPDDERLARVAMLGRLEILRPLPSNVLESLADSLSVVDVEDGAVVIEQGDPGDRFYVVASGTVHVSVDDSAPVALHEGEGFGEIALLHDVPRTATVSAHGPARLYVLRARRVPLRRDSLPLQRRGRSRGGRGEARAHAACRARRDELTPAYSSTLKLNIMPLSWCSAMWQ